MRSKGHRRPNAGDTPEATVVRGFTMLQRRRGSWSREIDSLKLVGDRSSLGPKPIYLFSPVASPLRLALHKSSYIVLLQSAYTAYCLL
jgi:hypothetical protein